MTGGCWNAQEAQLHINSLEMMAAFFAIKAFVKERQQISILHVLLTDSMSVVAHINKMGGTKSLLLTSRTCGHGVFKDKSQSQLSTYQVWTM
jgi:hypothetical protein